MPQNRIESGQWRRLHLSHLFHSKLLFFPLLGPIAFAVVVFTVGSVDGLTKVLIVIVLTILHGVVLFVPILVYLLLRHRAFRFQFQNDRLVIRTGLFELNDRIILYERLHGLDTTKSVLHRMFGTVKISLQTRSTSEELVLRSVDMSVAGELGQLLSDYQENRSHSIVSAVDREDEDIGSKDSMQPEPLHSMSILECCKLGFVRNRAALILSAVATFLVSRFSHLGSLLGDAFAVQFHVGPLDMTVSGGWIPWIEINVLEGVDAWELALFLAAVASVFVVFLAIVSLALAIFQFFKFRLDLDDSILRSESGLLVRAVQNTPLHRIQAIRILSTIRSRLVDRESIWCGTSAMPAVEVQPDLLNVLSNWLVPLVPISKTREIVRRVLPANVDFEQENWEAIDVARVWKRRLNLHLIYVLVITVVVALISWWLMVITVVLVGWAVWMSKLFAKSLLYQLLDNAIMFRKGWWSRSWTIVPFDKIQAVTVTQNLFDRRFNMARLGVDVSVTGPQNIGRCLLWIPYLELGRCAEIRDILIRESSLRENEW